MRTAHIFLLTLLIMVSTACSRNIYVYVPSPANSPALQEKKEFKGNIGPTNAQAAYAITDHIGVIASGQYIWKDLGPRLHGTSTYGGSLEGGLGYFKAWHKKRKAITVDVYAGYGKGGFRSVDYTWGKDSSRADNELRTRFRKYFIQPGFGITHRAIELALSTRVSAVHFEEASMGINALEASFPDNNWFVSYPNAAYEKQKFPTLQGRTIGLVENACTMRAGYRYIKYQLQAMICMPFGSDFFRGTDEQRENVYFQPIAVTMGVALNFGQWVQDSKVKKYKARP